MKAKILIPAVLLLTGCTFDDSLVHDPELRMMFQPEMYMHVAQDGAVSFPTDGSFAVCAWKNDTEEYLPVSEAVSNEVTITQGEVKNQVKDTLWMISEDILWPSIDDNLTFLAYAPYGTQCTCNLTDGVSFSTDILEDQTDLLFTHPHADRHKVENGWIVPLRFSHALCKMEFRIKNRVTDMEEITIRRITLEEAWHKGEFSSLKDPQWEHEGDRKEIVLFEGECPTGSLPERVGEGLLMIPQKLDTWLNIAYDYTTEAGSTIKMNIRTSPVRTRMEAGYCYTYTLSVGIDDVKLMEEIIGDTFK